MHVNYVSRDTYGMYKNSQKGPGPALMGADTLLGNDVYNLGNEKLGTIKESGEHIDRRPSRPAVDEGHEDHLVAAELFAVPRAMLSDEHSLLKARRQIDAGRPGQPQRRGVRAEGVVGD